MRAESYRTHKYTRAECGVVILATPHDHLANLVGDVLHDHEPVRHDVNGEQAWDHAAIQLVIAPRLAEMPLGLRAQLPTCVLITVGEVSNLRLLAKLPPVAEVVLASEIKSSLRDVVRRQHMRLPRAWLAREIDGLPRPSLLRALARALLQNHDRKASDARTASEAAKLIGCSRTHLYSVAKDADVSIPRLLDAVRLLRAVELRALTGISWERAAWKLGYSGGAGITALTRRLTGLPPQDLTTLDPAAVAELILCLLAGTRPWSFKPCRIPSTGEFGP